MVKIEPECCTKLLEDFERKNFPYTGEILNFSGVGDHDVYNISHPFEINGRNVIAGRVEKRDVWADSKIVFFEENGNSWNRINDAPILKLEDPFTTKLGDEIVLGGVEVYTENNAFNSRDIGYRTVFYKGKCFDSLQRFAQGPDKMKDIRLAYSTKGKIQVCTRPQGGQFGKGQIGYTELESIEELHEENILKAKIVEKIFKEDQWGGANELHLLEDGRIGVLGHISYEDEYGHKHYYAMTFIYDPLTHQTTPVEILATRKNFPKGEFKKPELEDVVFPGGLVRHKNGTATLYAGLSDAQAGRITLPDPFLLK